MGAGPAGATVSRLLSEQGFTVGLFDKSNFPRIKPCGGALTPRALPLLPKGFASQVRETGIQWTFRGKNREPVTLSTHEPFCYIVERVAFDTWLLLESQRSGTKVFLGTPIHDVVDEPHQFTVKTSQGSYSAPYLIGADGAKSVVARRLKLSRPLNGAALEIEVPVTDKIYRQWEHRVEIDTAHYPSGYAWVIPRYPVLNIGVGSFRAQGISLKRLMVDFVNTQIGNPPEHILAHPLPYRLTRQSLSKGRCVLIGDAAGLMDPFSAEGIYSALKSAHIAARAIKSHILNPSPLLEYDTILQRELWPMLKSASLMNRLFYPFSGFWSGVFSKNTDLLELYLTIAQGHKDYSELVRQTQRSVLKHMTPAVPNI